MEIILASEYPGDAGQKISAIFVDGFYQWLRYFSDDRRKLAEAFAHMFNPGAFYLAVSEGEICGIAAASDGRTKTVCLERRELRRNLGFIKGSIAYIILKKEFEEKRYPFAIEPGMGCVEFVAVSPEHRGRGVAAGIISHIFADTLFSSYVLEVADTNQNAVNLYKKLGFAEFLRIKEKHAKRSGINYLVYMRYDKPRA